MDGLEHKLCSGVAKSSHRTSVLDITNALVAKWEQIPTHRHPPKPSGSPVVPGIVEVIITANGGLNLKLDI